MDSILDGDCFLVPDFFFDITDLLTSLSGISIHFLIDGWSAETSKNLIISREEEEALSSEWFEILNHLFVSLYL